MNKGKKRLTLSEIRKALGSKGWRETGELQFSLDGILLTLCFCGDVTVGNEEVVSEKGTNIRYRECLSFPGFSEAMDYINII